MGRPSSERRSAATARAPCSTVLGRWWTGPPQGHVERIRRLHPKGTGCPGQRAGNGGHWPDPRSGGCRAVQGSGGRGAAAGRAAAHLRGEDVVVLGLPRGGVPVAAEVARALDAPLDVIVVRKLGVPFQPELAMGAVGEGGVLVRERARDGAGARQRGGVRRASRGGSAPRSSGGRCGSGGSATAGPGGPDGASSSTTGSRRDRPRARRAGWRGRGRGAGGAGRARRARPARALRAGRRRAGVLEMPRWF